MEQLESDDIPENHLELNWGVEATEFYFVCAHFVEPFAGFYYDALLGNLGDLLDLGLEVLDRLDVLHR